MLMMVASRWAANDPQAAIAWAGSLSDSAMRDEVLPGMVGTIAQNDPAQAAQLITQYSSGGPKATEAVSTLVWQWANTDPQSASRWAAALPESDLRRRALESLINRWAEADSAGASAWLSTLPGGDSRDAAVAAFAQRVVQSDPQTAVQWAMSISDENNRNTQIEAVLSDWLRTDPVAAKSWLSASSVPNDLKTRLLASGK